jgi:hypothetical protein
MRMLAAIKQKHIARAAAPAEHVLVLHVVTRSVPWVQKGWARQPGKEVTPQ